MRYSATPRIIKLTRAVVLAGTIVVVFLLVGCATYERSYDTYAKQCGSLKQPVIAKFTDSGNKPVTLYGPAKCPIVPPDNQIKYAVAAGLGVTAAVRDGVVYTAGANAISKIADSAGTKITAKDQATVSVRRGDGSFNSDIPGGINFNNKKKTVTTDVSTTIGSGSTDAASTDLLGP